MNRAILALLFIIGTAMAGPPVNNGIDIVTDDVHTQTAFKTFNNLGTESELVGSKFYMAFRLLDTALNVTFWPKTQSQAEQFCQHIGYEITKKHDWHLAKVHDVYDEAAINAMLGPQPDYQIGMWIDAKTDGNGQLWYPNYNPWTNPPNPGPYPGGQYPFQRFAGGQPANQPGDVYVKVNGVMQMYTTSPGALLNPNGLPYGQRVSGVLCQRCRTQDYPWKDNCMLKLTEIIE